MENDDIKKAIENLEKSYKDGNVQGIQVNSQYLDIKLKDQQNQLNKIVIDNLNKSNELLAGLQQSIQKSTESINTSNKALSDQQTDQNKLAVRSNVVLAIAAIISLVIALYSTCTTNTSAVQATSMANAQLRPYITIFPKPNGVSFKNKDTMVFSIFMNNIGKTPAVKILKGYNSSINFDDGHSIPGQSFREKSGDEDALAPKQVSAEQPLDVYVKGFNLNQKMSIKVEVLITYESSSEIYSGRYLSKAIYIITPISGTDFIVSQPKLFFGLAKDGW